MKKQLNPTIKAHLIRSALYFLLLLGVLAIPFALAQRQNSAKHKVAAPPAHSASVPAGNRVDTASGISPVSFQLTSRNVSDNKPEAMTFTLLSNVHEIDLTRAGIMPIPFNMPALRNVPDGAVVGSQNAYMATTADVVPPSTTRAVGTLFSGFAPGENVNYFLNGTLAATFAADANGRVGVFLDTPAGSGFATVEGIGQASGKRAGGVVEQSSTAPTSPGLAMAPHALGANGSRTFYLMGTRHPAGTTINIAVDGTVVFTVPSDATGSFLVSAAPAAAPDAPHVFTASTAMIVGSMAGVSVEARADAGDGDMNVTRGFVDRPIVPSGTGGFAALDAEGFVPNETLTLSVCCTGSCTAPADANGALGAFLAVPSGVGNASCVLTGGTSGRVATFEARGDPLATNAPGATTSASTMRTNGSASFLFQFDRLAPSESGTVFIDGVSQSGAGTDASGKGMMTLTGPAAIGPHSVIFAGVTGDLAIAPLYVVCAASYNFTLGTATFVPGVTDIGNHCDDCLTSISLPFPVMLYDQTFTTANAGSNGHLTFGAANASFDVTCSPFGFSGTTYVMAPYWTDQCTDNTGTICSTTCTNCGIFTTTTGSSPNRVFYVDADRLLRANGDNDPIGLRDRSV